MKKVAIIGFGFMGTIHTMNVLKNKNLELVAIIDTNLEMIENKLSNKNGNLSIKGTDLIELDGISKYSNIDDCFRSEKLDAVFICVHTSFHYELAKKALQNNQHVFIEKPFCLDIVKAEELIKLAEQKIRF